jgi:hypothetical protein
VNSIQGNGDYLIHISDPPTPGERLQLMAARLERRPIVLLPHLLPSANQLDAT